MICDVPWVISQEFLNKHQIDYVAYDALSCINPSRTNKFVYDYGKKACKFIETMRTDGISTSNLKMRVIKNYNEYVMHFLVHGYTCEELQFHYIKKKQLKAKMGIKKLREKIKQQHDCVG